MPAWWRRALTRARIADFTGAYQPSPVRYAFDCPTGGSRGERAERGAIYRRIGVEPIINGATTMTYLGGSLMPPEVVEAMRQASEAFVDLYELQDAVVAGSPS